MDEIRISQMRKGLLGWWTASDDRREWSCPFVVTDANKNSFSVQTLDDFKIVGPLRMRDAPSGDPSSRKEMRLASEQEIRDYLAEHRRELEDKVTKAMRQLEETQTRLSAYDVNRDRFLAETFPPKS